VRRQLAAARADGFEVVELFLQALGVAAGELLGAARCGFGFAWRVGWLADCQVDWGGLPWRDSGTVDGHSVFA